MKLKIALFCHPGDELTDTTTIYSERSARYTTYIQRSAYVEVDFPELPREETLERELAVLDSMEAKINAEASAKIAQVKEQRKKLLAITYQVVA